MEIVNTYAFRLGPEPESGGYLLLAVLTEGAVNDYAVYEGIVPDDMDHDAAAEAVMQNGRKCNYQRALTYFPMLPKEQYRA